MEEPEVRVTVTQLRALVSARRDTDAVIAGVELELYRLANNARSIATEIERLIPHVSSIDVVTVQPEITIIRRSLVRLLRDWDQGIFGESCEDRSHASTAEQGRTSGSADTESGGEDSGIGTEHVPSGLEE